MLQAPLIWKVKSEARSACIPVRTKPQLPTAVTHSLMSPLLAFLPSPESFISWNPY